MPTSPSDLRDDVADVVVVGAGPAGVAAAVAAAAAGARVVLLDAEARAGGQYWRQGPRGVGRYHHDVGTWRGLAAALARDVAAGAVDHRAGHRVWRVEPPADGAPAAVHATTSGPDGDAAVTVRGRTLVLAPGAHDRALPFPGWDTPGVLTAGAAQALLKEHGVLAGRRVVVGGTGPFLLPVAAGLADAGADVAAVCEANDGRGWLRGWRAVAALPGKAAEGARYAATLARHRVPVRPRTAVVAVHGRDAVEGVTLARLDAGWRVVPGSERHVECDAVAVGFGFLPRLDLPLQAGCATRTGDDGTPAVVVDALQRTTVDGVLVAGEATGVGGADLAVAEGRVAGAAAAAAALGRPDPAGPGPDVARLRAFAAALHAAHPVRDGWRTWLHDDTLVCRCEEVPLHALHAVVDDLGATDARTAKLLSRCGMGWCQGRVCGEAVSRIVSARTGAADPAARLVTDLVGTGTRPVAVPVPLGLLAAGDRAGRLDHPDPADPTPTPTGGSDARDHA